MTLLVAEDLFRFYHVGDEEIRALKGVSLTVETGEIVALVGPSGSGKSTLLSCLSGLDDPDGGTVEVDGRRMSRRPESEKAAIRTTGLGLLAQRDNLFEHLTVRQNVEFAQARSGSGSQIASILDAVGLTDRADAMPATLSGGETSRAGLAVALALDPPLLIADEPTAEVDAATEEKILVLFRDRMLRGKGTLIATHSAAVAAVATRVLHLADGLLAEGPVLETRRPTGSKGYAKARPPGPSLIHAIDLGRTFGPAGHQVQAVKGASLTLHVRDRIAITGASGSGKSTLLRMLAGLDQPSSGQIDWFGRDTAIGLRPARIGVVFQEPSLIPVLTVRENVGLPLQLRASGAAKTPLTADAALALLGLTDLADKMPDELSGGQMQRVAFARALVTMPDVILADEPTGQLDQPTAHTVINAVLKALDQTDTALLVTTHDLHLAAAMQTQFRMDHGLLAAADKAQVA